MNGTKSTVITIVIVYFAVVVFVIFSFGTGDFDITDIVILPEIDCPPRIWVVCIAARVCGHITVDSVACVGMCTDLTRRLAER